MRLTIYELMNRYVYPAIRRRLVEILYHDIGLNQMEIARLLGITQSAVSRYVVKNRGTFLDVSKFSEIEYDLRKIAKQVAERKLDEYTLHIELSRVIFKILAKGYVCNFHSKLDRTINLRKCSICPKLFSSYI